MLEDSEETQNLGDVDSWHIGGDGEGATIATTQRSTAMNVIFGKTSSTYDGIDHHHLLKNAFH